MSIYSTVSAHNATSSVETKPETPSTENPLVTLSALTDKHSTLAGVAVPPEEDSLAEYFSDDEERNQARKAQEKQAKEKQLNEKTETKREKDI